MGPESLRVDQKTQTSTDNIMNVTHPFTHHNTVLVTVLQSVEFGAKTMSSPAAANV